MHIKSFSVFILILIISCSTPPDIIDEPVINYKLYQGKWYEIARLPNPVENGLTCITMTYEYQDEGVMTVTSRGVNKNDPEDVKTLSGRAWIPDAEAPDKIKIQFIWPVTIDYVLIHIDEVKGYAVLGSPYKHQLWILGRSPVAADEDFDVLLKIAEKNEYKTESLIRVDHSCD
jgi:apolipoprotein D and lipocalin family protein